MYLLQYVGGLIILTARGIESLRIIIKLVLYLFEGTRVLLLNSKRHACTPLVLDTC